MSRNDGNASASTKKSSHRRQTGHRMHRRGKAARDAARRGNGRGIKQTPTRLG